MDPGQLFSQALPLEHLWTVTSNALEGESRKLVLTVDLVKRTRSLPCPGCGKECRIHDRRERRWRHLNFWQYETVLTARVPRTDCSECGFHQVEVPWARPGSGFTLLFEAMAILLARDMAVSDASETRKETEEGGGALRPGPDVLWRLEEGVDLEAGRLPAGELRIDGHSFQAEPCRT